jgi:trehalose 6-phosphate synthase
MPVANGDASSGRLLLLSNRLPITIKRSEDGSYNFSMSSGGLVTGLSGLSKTTSFQWYGWPGLEVPENEVEGMKKRLKDDYGAHPVFIDDELADRHYNGFSSEFPGFCDDRAETDNGRRNPVAPFPLPSR